MPNKLICLNNFKQAAYNASQFKTFNIFNKKRKKKNKWHESSKPIKVMFMIHNKNTWQ